MDYEALSVILEFEACEIRQCVALTIVDDSEFELNENLFYILERTPGLNSNIELTQTQGEIEILNDDGKILMFDSQHSTVIADYYSHYRRIFSVLY